MLSVDMGSVTETLFESELFGHVKGAFTNASADRAGKFEAADGSTLHGRNRQSASLPAVQAVNRHPEPQDREGGEQQAGRCRHKTYICATNCDLQAMVADGRFRQDLLYRINTIHLEIPPLRQRKDDIVPLPKCS